MSGQLALGPPGVADPAPYGLDAPVAVGPYLNGVFPSQRPTDPSTSTWTVVPAFPNLSFDDTTVIASPPAAAGVWAIAYDETTGLASKTLLTTFPGGALATWGQDNAGEV